MGRHPAAEWRGGVGGRSSRACWGSECDRRQRQRRRRWPCRAAARTHTGGRRLPAACRPPSCRPAADGKPSFEQRTDEPDSARAAWPPTGCARSRGHFAAAHSPATASAGRHGACALLLPVPVRVRACVRVRARSRRGVRPCTSASRIWTGTCAGRQGPACRFCSVRTLRL